MGDKRAPIPRAIARDDKPSPIEARRRRGVLLIVGGLVAGAALFVALIVLSRIGGSKQLRLQVVADNLIVTTDDGRSAQYRVR